jgi:ParB-like nuclease domain
MLAMQWIAVDAIKPNIRNARTHSKKQIRQIADSIAAFGFLVPIVIDEGGVVIAGHGRYAAAGLLGLQEIPVIRVEGLLQAKRRALALADNKIAENAGWDRELLAAELPELADILIVESDSGTAATPVDGVFGSDRQCHAADDSGAITFSGTFSGTLVGARSGTGAGAGTGI